MRTDLNELQNFLKKEYEIKMKFNPSYSQKAFARDLDIPATTLNEFFAGNRELSFKNLNSIFGYINSNIHCSFCDKPQKNAGYIIAGPRKLYICDSCVEGCNQIAEENRVAPPAP